MKTQAKALNMARVVGNGFVTGLAMVMILTACGKPKAKVEEPAPVKQDENLKVSEKVGDGIYNLLEIPPTGQDSYEKVLFYTPPVDMGLYFEGAAVATAGGCDIQKVQHQYFIEEYDNQGQVVARQRFNYFSSAVPLRKDVRYGLRAQLTGLAGCRSVYVSLTVSKAP
ncbi:MAG: hypothetical protein AB7F86_10920 [Bdellovibrionales bacterium]